MSLIMNSLLVFRWNSISLQYQQFRAPYGSIQISLLATFPHPKIVRSMTSEIDFYSHLPFLSKLKIVLVDMPQTNFIPSVFVNVFLRIFDVRIFCASLFILTRAWMLCVPELCGYVFLGGPHFSSQRPEAIEAEFSISACILHLDNYLHTLVSPLPRIHFHLK